jgi:DNA-binding transcriptional regulator YhcF (GntR family)
MIDTVSATTIRPELRPIKVSRQIADDIRWKVRSGAYAPGEVLPSRRQLAKHFGVAVGTVQEAVSKLVDEGVLVARSTARTEVANPRNARASAVRTTVSDTSVGIACDLKPLEDPAANVWRHAIVSAIERELGAQGRETHFLNQYRYADIWPNCADAASQLCGEGYKTIVLVLPDARYSIPGLIRWSRSPEASLTRTIVIADRPMPMPLWSVYWIGPSVGIEAAAHLMAAGCRNLIFFSPFEDSWVRARAEAAREYVLCAGGEGDTFRTEITTAAVKLLNEEQIEIAYQAALPLVERLPARAGIIAANDHIAIGWIRAARERGLVAGRDYAITGADDTLAARENALTTFSVPLDAMAVEAVRLAGLTGGTRQGPTNFGIQPQILVRKSSRVDWP